MGRRGSEGQGEGGKGEEERGEEGGKEKEGEGEGEEEALLVMWPTKLSPLNPPLSTSESSATVTESPELSDESSESVTASPQPVSRSPGTRLGLDVVAAPFPPPEASEMEPEDVASNTC